MMTVMILGAPEEAHAAYILSKIQKRGQSAFFFDTRRFPSQIKLNVLVGNASGSTQSLGFLEDTQAQLRIPLENINAVYWRYHYGIQTPPEITDNFLAGMAHREIESALGSFFRMLNCRWLNSPAAIAMHVFKPYQSHVMHQLGLRVPQTLISNDPSGVQDFYHQLNGQVIYKPVRGGAHTQQLNSDDLTKERLAELAQAPVQFQEMIEGVDIRVYLIGEETFAAEIRSSTLDFRGDPNAAIVPVELPDAIRQQCRQAADALMLGYSGIDIRRTPAGDYVFLECNPCPMFMHFENMTGYPISDRLVDLLLTAQS
jgi:hypothetical protein